MNLIEVLSPKSKSDNEIYKKTEMYTISTIPKEILKTSGYIFDFTIPVIRNGSSLLKLSLLKLPLRLVDHASLSRLFADINSACCKQFGIK